MKISNTMLNGSGELAEVFSLSLLNVMWAPGFSYIPFVKVMILSSIPSFLIDFIMYGHWIWSNTDLFLKDHCACCTRHEFLEGNKAAEGPVGKTNTRTHTRDDGGLNWNAGSEDKWTDSRCILDQESIGLAGVLNVLREGKGGIKMHF